MGNLPEAVGPENRPGIPAVRASDADRERVAAALQAAFAEGRLTMPELEERLTAAYAAETDAELPPLMHDLRASAAQPGDWAGAAPTSTRDVGIIASTVRSPMTLINWSASLLLRLLGKTRRSTRPNCLSGRSEERRGGEESRYLRW